MEPFEEDPLYEELSWRDNASHNPTLGHVEVAWAPPFVWLRWSGDRGFVMKFDPAEWADFIAGAKAGMFDFN
jgi:hypothetical protein